MGWLPLANLAVALASVLYLLDFFVVSRIAWFRKLLGLRKPSTEPRFWSLSRMLGVVIVAGGLALAYPPWDLWRILVGGGVVTAFSVVSVSDYRKWKVVHPSPIDDAAPPARPPITSSLGEILGLAEQFTKTSKAIYAFLNKQAMRSDEPKVLAEYRQRFDARVFNLCLDLISAGLSDNDRLSVAMTPPSSVTEIQWIARVLAVVGQGFGPGLEATAMKTGAGVLVRTRKIEGRFLRFESAVDSFGNEPKQLATALAVADGTGHDLTPGDEVTYQLELADPSGDDAIISFIPPGGFGDNVSVVITADGSITWIVRDEDVADSAYVNIFATSRRNYHRTSQGFDDAVSFIYRVIARA